MSAMNADATSMSSMVMTRSLVFVFWPRISVPGVW